MTGMHAVPARPDVDDPHAAAWALVERAQAGDSGAFADIYRLHYARIRTYAGYRARPDLADDFAQETFARALRTIGGFTWQGRDIAAWLTTICHNLVADYYKKHSVRREMNVGSILEFETAADSAPLGAALDRAADEESLYAILAQLGPADRRVLICRHLLGMSLDETATHLGRTKTGVKSQAFRAMAAARRIAAGGAP